MESLSMRFNEQKGGLYDYTQIGGKKKQKDSGNTKDECDNFKQLYLKTKKELDEANIEIKKLKKKINSTQKFDK